MKYIDSDKLKVEIERRLNIVEPHKDTFESAAASRQELIWMKDFITSLQQEQLEVDFEKELDRIWFDNKLGDYFDNDALDYAHIRTLCKHFYELGLNARKEE